VRQALLYSFADSVCPVNPSRTIETITEYELEGLVRFRCVGEFFASVHANTATRCPRACYGWWL
jgi:hypothetical protein